MIPIVNTRSYELVRDRIAEILANELPNQAVLHSDSNLNTTVFIDRIIPIHNEEVPLINVLMANGSYDNFTQIKQDGTYIYNVDIYVGSPGSSDSQGDVLSMNKLQKLAGVVQGILMHPNYVTLGFDRPFIEHREVRSITTGVPNNNMDASNVTQARLELVVRVPETSLTATPNNIAGYDTQVKINLTDKGYIYSGDNIPIPDPVCEVLTYVYNSENTLLLTKTVNDNDNTITVPNINFTDSDNTTTSVASGVNIVATQCAPFEDATIHNSDNSYTATVGSGEDLELPDSDVSINGNLFDILPATNDLDINVYQGTGNTEIGAKQGQYYRIGDSLIQLDGADGLELISNLPATEGLTLKVTNEDLETIPQVYVDGDNLVVEEIQIRNSDETFSQTIDYINDNTLADVPNVDSDGTIVSTPAMTPFVCTPSTPITGIVTDDLYLNLDTSNVLSYNDPSSNWLDLTPYRNDSSLVSSPTYSAIYGGVLIYDGVNDYATITNDFELDMTQAWEMQFVLNLDSTFGAVRPSLALLKTSNGVPINIFLDNNNGIWVASPGGITLQAFKNGNQIPLDENLIINLSFDGLNAFDINSFRLEINGVNESLLTSVNSGTTLNINYIGQTIGSHFYRFKGYIPRVFAWSRQLDASEKQRQLDVLKAQYNIV